MDCHDIKYSLLFSFIEKMGGKVHINDIPLSLSCELKSAISNGLLGVTNDWFVMVRVK